MNQPDETLPTRLERTTIYESPWVNLYRDRVSMPNGHIYEAYHFLDFGRGSVVVIVEDGHGRILMERIARYPTDSVTWELPAGGIDGDESILDAAAREVLEETGYTTTNHQEIYAYNPINGISNLTIFVVHCTVSQRVGEIDENEIQAVRWFSLDELSAAIRDKAITDGLSLTGLLLYMSQHCV